MLWLSNLKAHVVGLCDLPCPHTKRGPPASSSFACQTESGRGTGLMGDGGAAWRRCRLVSSSSLEK